MSRHSAHQSSPSQRNKSIMIGMAVVLVVALVIGVGWYLLSPQRQYTKQARGILDQISAYRDLRGFYGDYQTCLASSDHKYDCTLSTTPNLVGTEWAHEYETLAVIWARYHYYLRTKDKSQLAQVKQDLTLFHTTLMEHAPNNQPDTFDGSNDGSEIDDTTTDLIDESESKWLDNSTSDTYLFDLKSLFGVAHAQEANLTNSSTNTTNNSSVVNSTATSVYDQSPSDLTDQELINTTTMDLGNTDLPYDGQVIYVDEVFELTPALSPQEAHPENYITTSDGTVYHKERVDETFIIAHLYNCLLLQDLVNSPHLDDKYRQMAREICLYLPFSTAPVSTLHADAHDHYLDLAPTAYYSSAFGVEIDEWYEQLAQEENDFYFTDSSNDLPTIEAASLIASIDQTLTNFLTNSTPTTTTYPRHAQAYLTDELYAAVDHTAKLALVKTDSTLYDQVLLDYLQLTQETLAWYLSDPLLQDQFNTCLLSANLSYYLDHFSASLTSADKHQLTGHLPSITDYDAPSCLLAQKVINHHSIAKAQLSTYLTQLTTNQLTDDNNFYFDIYPQALGAGLLSW